MGDQSVYPRVIFYEGFDERYWEPKGYFEAHVELGNGNHYELNFIVPWRLEEELKDEIQMGQPCHAELNLIVVPTVTVEAIQQSVQYLWRIGFFNDLKPEQQKTEH